MKLKSIFSLVLIISTCPGTTPFALLYILPPIVQTRTRAQTLFRPCLSLVSQIVRNNFTFFFFQFRPLLALAYIIIVDVDNGENQSIDGNFRKKNVFPTIEPNPKPACVPLEYSFKPRLCCTPACNSIRIENRIEF